MNNILNFKDLEPDTNLNECKGLFYKVRINAFIAKDGRIVQKIELRKLKKKSCPGCVMCAANQDYLENYIENIEDSKLFSNLEDGKVYLIWPNFEEYGEKEYLTDCEFIKVDERCIKQKK